MMAYGMSAAQQPQRSSEEDDLWITNTDNIHKETSTAKLEIRRNGIFWLQGGKRLRLSRGAIITSSARHLTE